MRVGLAGFGTVGQGVCRLLQQNADLVTHRLGCAIQISRIASRRKKPECPADIPFELDLMSLVSAEDVDVIVELIGGVEAAYSLVMAAIEAGKPVVTANKALIAERGTELLAMAHERNVPVMFEAAVAGGIPIIKALKEGLSGNRIDKIVGIINGTSNYVMTEMRAGRGYLEVLSQAQALGYAEADPSFDVNGTDAAHKLTILASIAFGIPLSFEQVYMEGITQLDPMDFACADMLGYRIKHLGIAEAFSPAAGTKERGISLRVHPAMVSASALLSHVEGVMNAVAIRSDAVSESLFYGPGAGSLPTASAVVADLMDLARVNAFVSGPASLSPLGFLVKSDSDRPKLPILPVQSMTMPYYLRVKAPNRSGMLADIAQSLSDRGINIESILQRHEWAEEDCVPIVIVTQPAIEQQVVEAIAAIEQLTHAFVMKIRIQI